MVALDEVYTRALDAIDGLRYQLVAAWGSNKGPGGFDAELRIQGDTGARRLLVQQYRSHLGHKTTDHIVASVKNSSTPVLILAPHIGAGLAAKLAAAGINYLDARGNCHISAPPLYIHVEGKAAAPVRPADKGLRSAGYRVLFAYLAEPGLLDRPIREVAEHAGVSRQPVSDMKRRLIDDDYVFEAKSSHRWHPRRRQEALSLWLHGYQTTVRPPLVHESYRTRDTNPGELEEKLVAIFRQGSSDLRWGGSAAGFRLSKHHRGERTVAHVHAVPESLPKQLRALSDPAGNLVLMDAFGQLNWSYRGDTVHPLLVYSEMLSEGTERAREAAQIVYDQHLAPIWDDAP